MGALVKLVLFVLETYASTSEGIAWPSLETLADDCELSYVATRKAVQRAIAGGWLVILPGPPPAAADPRVNVYKLLPPGYPLPPEDGGKTPKAKKRRGADRGRQTTPI